MIDPLPYSLQSLLLEDPTTSTALMILLFGKYSLNSYYVYSILLSMLVRVTKKDCNRYEQKEYRGEGEEGKQTGQPLRSKSDSSSPARASSR